MTLLDKSLQLTEVQKAFSGGSAAAQATFQSSVSGAFFRAARGLRISRRRTDLHPVPPAVAVGTSDPMTAGMMQFPWRNAARIINGSPSYDATNVRINTGSGSMPGVSYTTNAIQTTIAWNCGVAGKERISVFVDGYPLWAGARAPRVNMLDTGSAAITTTLGTAYFLTLTFATSAVRLIEVMISGAAGYQYVRVPITAACEPGPRRPVAMIVSDSFFAGSDGIPDLGDYPAAQLARIYECDVINNAVASSGYVAGTAWSTASRVNHAAVTKPDVIVFWGSVNDSAGTLTVAQGAPYRDWRATPFTASATLLNSAWSPGRCVALKRNSVFNSYQATGLEGYLARLFIRKPTGATQFYPERRTLMAYGQGRLPVIEGGANGVLRFGIRVLETSSTTHEGFITFQDIAVTAVGGTLAGSGGAGIMIPVLSSEASPGYSTHPNGCVLIGCKVYDFYMKDFGTESGADVNGIQTFGSDVTIVNCEVTGCGDDNYWILGSNLKIVGNRSSGSAVHSVAWPNRQRGDEMQINSSPWNGNGDTVCHNVLVVGNSLVHNNPNKHVLIINPEVTGTNTLSRNYQVSYNYMESAKPSAGGISQLQFYCSGFEGTVNKNFVVSNHTRATTDNASVFLNCAAEFFNNLIIVNGNYRGIEVGSISLNGGAVVNTANGARIYNNTLINRGTSTMGILNWTAGVTVAVYNNTVIGFTTGIQLVTGSQGGYNAFQNCTTNYNGGGTMLGGDITGVDLKTYYGIPYSSSSPLRSVGLVTGDSLFDTFSGARRIGSRPTIGCEEAPII